MDIKEILRKFTRSGPSYMPYHDEEGLLYIIWYLDNYHPYRQQGIKNWRFDQTSSVMLRFKQGQPEAIGYYLLKILGKFGRHEKYRDVIEDSNLRFAVVPGHEAGKDESSVHKLARMLSAYYGRADYSRCLRRKHNMAKLSTGGSRSLLEQYQSMEVDARYTVSGKKFLLPDDIVTTGNSMMAARKRLLETGAADVYPLAMAQTVLEPETPFSNKEAQYNPVNMDDTLSSGTNSTGRWFSISTKMVVNGRLKEVITWNYTKFQTDMWRYQTNTMDQSHDTVVSPGDKVFAYGMNRLGWPYEVREFWVY